MKQLQQQLEGLTDKKEEENALCIHINVAAEKVHVVQLTTIPRTYVHEM